MKLCKRRGATQVDVWCLMRIWNYSGMHIAFQTKNERTLVLRHHTLLTFLNLPMNNDTVLQANKFAHAH